MSSRPSSGTILPPSEVTMTVVVRYTPLAMGCYSLDRYHFRTPGNCNTLLTCWYSSNTLLEWIACSNNFLLSNISGMTMPPKVTLYKQPTSSATKQLEDKTAALTVRNTVTSTITTYHINNRSNNVRTYVCTTICAYVY